MKNLLSLLREGLMAVPLLHSSATEEKCITKPASWAVQWLSDATQGTLTGATFAMVREKCAKICTELGGDGAAQARNSCGCPLLADLGVQPLSISRSCC